MNKYDYKTRTRALFAISIGFIQGYNVDLEEDFFIMLRDFSNQKLQEDLLNNIDYINLVLYLKMVNHKLQSIETEKTVKDLYDILDEIKSEKDLLKLYDSIKQEDIDKVSELASEFVEYMNFMYQSPNTLIPQ
ncbi:MAG: hypothetical protein IKR57_04245 [Bacilli bacterium]|nr:hypothetical protein [Bacilli bacterium]